MGEGVEDEVWRRASRPSRRYGTKWATQRGPFSTKTSMVKVQLSPAALILSHTWLSLTWLKPDYLANGFPFGSQSSMPTWSLYLILRSIASICTMKLQICLHVEAASPLQIPKDLEPIFADFEMGWKNHSSHL